MRRQIVRIHWGDLVWDDSRVIRPRRTHGKSLWRKILMQWPQFKENLRWKAGRGNKIRFWKDAWIDNVALLNRFPRIYSIVQAQNIVLLI